MRRLPAPTSVVCAPMLQRDRPGRRWSRALTPCLDHRQDSAIGHYAFIRAIDCFRWPRDAVSSRPISRRCRAHANLAMLGSARKDAHMGLLDGLLAQVTENVDVKNL